MIGSLRTPLTELIGVGTRSCRPAWAGSPAPGWSSATANAGGLGILASATMTHRRARDGDRRGQGRTDQPFGVNLRADAADAGDRVDLLISTASRSRRSRWRPSRS